MAGARSCSYARASATSPPTNGPRAATWTCPGSVTPCSQRTETAPDDGPDHICARLRAQPRHLPNVRNAPEYPQHQLKSDGSQSRIQVPWLDPPQVQEDPRPPIPSPLERHPRLLQLLVRTMQSLKDSTPEPNTVTHLNALTHPKQRKGCLFLIR